MAPPGPQMQQPAAQPQQPAQSSPLPIQALSVSAAPPQEARERFRAFMRTLQQVLSNNLDQAKFEDDLRETLGISSYVLFTLDKLVFQLLKQAQSVLSDELCAKLLALHEQSLSPEAYASSVRDALQDERCFKLELELAPQAGRLGVQLPDPPSNAAGTRPPYMDLGFAKDKWAGYVDQYTTGDAADLDMRKHRVFLLRNQLRNINAPTIMDNVEVHNALEVKIANTYKMFFVEETEDFFHRRRPQSRLTLERFDQLKKTGIDKLHRWQEGRLVEMSK